MICLVTEYVAANCSVCGKPACPVHIVQHRETCSCYRNHPSQMSAAALESGAVAECNADCERCKGKGIIITDRFFDTEHCPIRHRVAAEKVA
jgi:hypothetical protein